jgi:hypothetical protein
MMQHICYLSCYARLSRFVYQSDEPIGTAPNPLGRLGRYPSKCPNVRRARGGADLLAKETGGTGDNAILKVWVSDVVGDRGDWRTAPIRPIWNMGDPSVWAVGGSRPERAGMDPDGSVSDGWERMGRKEGDAVTFWLSDDFVGEWRVGPAS